MSSEPIQLKYGVCDVHRLVNKDNKIRQVQFCKMCDSWICEECWYNLPKRALAASKKLAGY